MNSIFNSLVLAGAILVSGTAMAKEGANIEVKADSLHYLQELRNKESRRLRDINDSLSKRMEDAPTAGMDKEVEILKTAQHEHQLRQEFLDRLIFQVDTKFGGGDLRGFLERVLVDMAKVDAISSATTDTGLWKFLKYSADAIRRLPEQKENILAFLEGYMNKSVANPVRPEDYLATRNYTNGASSDAGRPLNREDAGAIADLRMHEAPAVQQEAAPVIQKQVQ